MASHTRRTKRLAKGFRSHAKVRLTISLEPELFERLRHLADTRKVPMNTVIREAIADAPVDRQMFLEC